MNKKIYLAAIALLLPACTEVAQSANRAYDGTRAGIYNSAGKVQDLMRYDPPSTVPQQPQTRYCYRSMADIICYEEPQIHISNQLVGYQGVPPHPVVQGGYRPAPGERYGGVKPVAYAEPMMAMDGTEVTPFYGEQDRYMKPNGEVVESNKVVVSRDGSISMGDLPPPVTVQTGAPASAEQAAGPRTLMPRY